ncbi:putative gliding motility-associated protein GldE [Helianthus annuus]|nr:putative CBS domain, CNNM, transmembrane domain-containing protein [Helianthus annuus]KAJ0531129.1 putative CBS domain, CNNM, transmembrane domain-containing protein [Helianthus annuus]KAJ0885071.1 putative gliding motility-associated protein GldE [Helianthus annuus]
MHAINVVQIIRMATSSTTDSMLGAEIEFGSVMFFVYVGISAFLVIFAGIMSGLTLGLMSLGLVELEILQRSGTPTEKKQAVSVIFPVVQKQHQLLVTLLLCNAGAMEALPIYLDKIFNQIVAIVLSVTFVLFFGEVIPQAVCTRYGLAIGSSFIWLVKVLMIICYPIAYPIGKMLDLVLGHNDALFRRAQLKALVSIHGQEAGKGGELTHDETTIISGALDLTEKTAEEAMTPIESTFSLDVNSKLDWEAMGKILARGHSRVPVYSGNPRNIIGLLLVKSLLTVRAETETPVSAVSIRRIPRVPADMPLYDILNEFQKGSSHMAAVVKTKGKGRKPPTLAEEPTQETITVRYSQSTNPLVSKQGEKSDNVTIDVEKVGTQTNGVPYSAEDIEEGEVIGIITLEDVFEELLQEEIVDETDEFVDVHKRIRVAAAAAASSVARAPSVRRLTALAQQQGGQYKGGQTPRKSGDEDSTSKLNRALAEPLLKKET